MEKTDWKAFWNPRRWLAPGPQPDQHIASVLFRAAYRGYEPGAGEDPVLRRFLPGPEQSRRNREVGTVTGPAAADRTAGL